MNSTKSNKRRRRRPRPLRLISPIHKANRQVALHMSENMTGFGIGPSEAHILSYLESYGPCPIGELVRVFGYKKPTMTSMLDRLERRGLVTRELNANDRRSFLIEVAPAGVDLAQTARVLVEKLDHAISKRVSTDDLKGFDNVMHAVADVTGVNVRLRTNRLNTMPAKRRKKDA